MSFNDKELDSLLEGLSDEELDALIKDTPVAKKVKPKGPPLRDWLRTWVPGHWPIPPHLEPLLAAIDRASREPVRLLVSMPPRHGKTETIITGLGWNVARFPDRLNAYTTYSASRAKGKSRKARRLALRAGVNLDKAAASVYDWRTLQGGGLICGGIDSGLTGEGIEGILVVDDPFKGPKEAQSELVRESVHEWFNEVAYTRLNPGGSCIVVQTRWHDEDLIGHLHALSSSGDLQETWEYLNVPAIRDREEIFGSEPADDDSAVQRALWPDRYPLERLRAIRSLIGPYSFSALFQGRPVPRGGRVFGNPARYSKLPDEKFRIVIAVDAAGTAKTKSDYTAAVVIATVGRAEYMKAYLLEVLRFRKDVSDSGQLQEAAEKLYKLQQRWGNTGLAIEKSRDGEAMYKAIKSINRNLKLYLIPPIGDKFTRSQPCAAGWNDNRFLVPMHAPWLQDYLSEMAKFTGVSDAHDDQVDATSHAWNVASGIAPLQQDGIAIVGKSRWSPSQPNEVIDRNSSPWG